MAAGCPMADGKHAHSTKPPLITTEGLNEQVNREPWSVLGEEGEVVPGAEPTLEDTALRKACELMLLSRAFDDKAFSLQRQGRFGTFSPVKGQEASVVGAALALDRDSRLDGAAIP